MTYFGGTTYLTMEFVNGNYSYGSSNRGTLIVKITVVPYGELTLETVREELVIDLFSELQYQTGDTFCLRIGDSDHVDGSSNPSYVDYVLTMESIRELSVEFDYILGHSYWIRLLKATLNQIFLLVIFPSLFLIIRLNLATKKENTQATITAV